MTSPKIEAPNDQARSTASLGRMTLSKVSRRLIPFMFVLYIANFVDRVNVSFAALGMNKDLGLSSTAYGFGAGVFFVGYVLFQIPANLILLRVGARRWIGGIMIAWGVVAGAMSLIHTPAQFYVLRVLLGFAEAGFFPGMIMYLTLWFPATERAQAVSRFMTAIPIAGILGGPLAGALLSMEGWAGIAGWRWLFFLEALPSLVLGVAALRYLSDRPAEAKWLESDEREWLDGALRREHEMVAQRFDVSPLKTLANGTVWALATLWLLTALPAYGLLLWLPQLIREHSTQSDLVVGFLSAIPAIAGCVSMIVVGWHSDRTGERFLHLAIPLAIGTAGIATLAFSHSLPQTLFGLALASIGYSGCYGPFWTLPGRFLHGAGAASSIGLINAVGNVGGFVGPYALGAIKDRTQSFEVALLGMAALMGSAALVAWLLKRAPLLADHHL